MRLQELFETTEEDRALISLSSAIYNTVSKYIGTNEQEIKVGKVGDLYDTSIPALNNINIEILDNETFLERMIDPDDPVDYSDKEIYAMWDEDRETVVLNAAYLDRHRMKTTITHELRHALDYIKSNGFPGDANRYFTPKKKEHRIDDPYSTIQYRARPAEINARFVEVLDILSKRIPKWVEKLDPSQVKKQLSTDFKHLLVKYEIADIFPEKTESPDYKRLVKRAYDFMQKELDYAEQQSGKKIAGNW